MPNAQEAFALAARGWRVHPLVPKQKNPLVTAWQKAATTDEEVIADWWDRWPGANIGIVMGPSSGIIDIEADTPEADKFLADLFDGHEIITPTFQTARGKHRLFKYTDQLPNSDKAHWRLRGDLDLDFKIGNGKGTYCMFPPSIHPDGPQYKWLLHPDEVDVAELPDQVIARLWAFAQEGAFQATEGQARSQKHWDEILKGVGAGQRNESAASLIGMAVASMADPSDAKQLKVQYDLIQSWNQRNNPPLEEKELRRTFQSIVEREVQKLASQRFIKPKSREQLKEGEDQFGDWRLTRVDADPPYYKLYSPLWEGGVELDDDELLISQRIRRAVQSQKCVGLEPSFRAFWEGGKKRESAYTHCMARIKRESAHFDERLENVLALRVYERLCNAQVNQTLTQNGRPVRIEGDEDATWFKFDFLKAEDRMILDHAPVVAKLLKRVCDGPDRVRRKNGGQTRWKVIRKEGMDCLRKLAFFDAQEEDDDEDADVGQRHVSVAD